MMLEKSVGFRLRCLFADSGAASPQDLQEVHSGIDEFLRDSGEGCPDIDGRAGRNTEELRRGDANDGDRVSALLNRLADRAGVSPELTLPVARADDCVIRRARFVFAVGEEPAGAGVETENGEIV